MSEQHTPGHWTIEAERDDEPAFIVAPQGGTIAEVGSILNDPDSAAETWEERDANARLIVAAPDLLAFVQRIRTWLVAPRTDLDTLSTIQAEARDLIVRVEGQTPDPVPSVPPVRTVQTVPGPVQRGCPECGFHHGQHEVFCSQGRD